MEWLTEDILAQVNQQVYNQFPQVRGVRPTQKRAPSGSHLLLTYRHCATTEDGYAIECIVRATVTPDGRVVKLVTRR